MQVQVHTSAPVAKPPGWGSAGQLARVDLFQWLEQEVGDKSRNVTLVSAASENPESPTHSTVATILSS